MRAIARPFVAAPSTAVCIRDRIKGLSAEDEQVLRVVGAHLGSLASNDLKTRISEGLKHSPGSWAARKRELTPESSARWAGSITKATHDQWGLARRALWARIEAVRAGITTLRFRLSLELRRRGSGGGPGGYRSRREWFAKSRRLAHLERLLTELTSTYEAGEVSVVRGGRRLLHARHQLEAAGLAERQWRDRWEAARWFLSADGESGKRLGNETLRVAPDGRISLRLPTPLVHLANAPSGQYVLDACVSFPFRGEEWRDRIATNRAVAYRIHKDAVRGRWYLDARWQRKDLPVVPLETLRTGEVIGVDANADHLAAWRLDPHGNPLGPPRTFAHDLSGSSGRRDAQVRHALTRLLRWAADNEVRAIAIENLDFTDSRTREKHGRHKRFRALINGFPTARLRNRLLAMCAEHGIAVIAVDPAYTSKWGAQHWRRPLSTTTRPVTRHQAAAMAIARRALGHGIRRRAAPPHGDQSDRCGPRTVQARSHDPARKGTRPPDPDHGHDPTGPATRPPPVAGANADTQDAHHRSGRPAEHGQPAPGLSGTVRPRLEMGTAYARERPEPAPRTSR